MFALFGVNYLFCFASMCCRFVLILGFDYLLYFDCFAFGLIVCCLVGMLAVCLLCEFGLVCDLIRLLCYCRLVFFNFVRFFG